MKKFVKLISVILSVFLIATIFSACKKESSESSSLVGRWEATDSYSSGHDELEFFDDGSCHYDSSVAEYSASKNRLMLTRKTSTSAITYSYRITNNTLTLTDDDGYVSNYKRVD